MTQEIKHAPTAKSESGHRRTNSLNQLMNAATIADLQHLLCLMTSSELESMFVSKSLQYAELSHEVDYLRLKLLQAERDNKLLTEEREANLDMMVELHDVVQNLQDQLENIQMNRSSALDIKQNAPQPVDREIIESLTKERNALATRCDSLQQEIAELKRKSMERELQSNKSLRSMRSQIDDIEEKRNLLFNKCDDLESVIKVMIEEKATQQARIEALEIRLSLYATAQVEENSNKNLSKRIQPETRLSSVVVPVINEEAEFDNYKSRFEALKSTRVNEAYSFDESVYIETGEAKFEVSSEHAYKCKTSAKDRIISYNEPRMKKLDEAIDAVANHMDIFDHYRIKRDAGVELENKETQLDASEKYFHNFITDRCKGFDSFDKEEEMSNAKINETRDDDSANMQIGKCNENSHENRFALNSSWEFKFTEGIDQGFANFDKGFTDFEMGFANFEAHFSPSEKPITEPAFPPKQSSDFEAVRIEI